MNALEIPTIIRTRLPTFDHLRETQHEQLLAVWLCGREGLNT